MRVEIKLTETVNRKVTVVLETEEPEAFFEASDVRGEISEFARDALDWDEDSDWGVEVDRVSQIEPEDPERKTDGYLIKSRGIPEVTKDVKRYKAYLARFAKKKKTVPVLPGQMRLPETEQ